MKRFVEGESRMQSPLFLDQLDLFSDAFVAIDGSKFKAVNHRDINLTRAKSIFASLLLWA